MTTGNNEDRELHDEWVRAEISNEQFLKAVENYLLLAYGTHKDDRTGTGTLSSYRHRAVVDAPRSER